MENPIRVLLVDSSPLALKVLQHVLKDSPEIAIVGTARHGREALRLLPIVLPEVICLSAHLPVLDAPDLTREVMIQQACPILVLTSENERGIDAQSSKEAVAACIKEGAVDSFSLPSVAIVVGSPQARALVAKIKLLARVRVISRSASRRPAQVQTVPVKTEKAASPNIVEVAKAKPARQTRPAHIVAIGASTGGPQVLLAILSALPRDYPFPILCVQHISKGFIAGLADWLKEQCRIRVKIASHGEVLMPGTAYFPEDDNHLELGEDMTVKLSSSPLVDGHRPSVTSLFNSVARSHGNRTVAVLLTGMGADGAQGLKTVLTAGGTTLVQDKESCVVFGMPAKAIELGAAQHVLSPSQIARHLIELAQ